MCRVAELWALLDGLQLALSLNMTKLVITVDATAVVSLISSFSLSNPILCTLLLMTTRCSYIDSGKCPSPCFKEGNRYTNAMAGIVS